MTSTRSIPSMVGLLLGWGGTALLVSPLGDLLGDPASLNAALLAQVLLWLLFAVVVLLVLFWETQPLASLWLRPVISPAIDWIRRAAGFSGYAAGMDMVMLGPVWFRVVAAVSAGVVEETLFRGFAVTRLLRMTGSPLFAIVVSSAVSAGPHFPLWGAGPTFSWFVGGVATTALFVWRRVLLTMVLFHAATDVWGLAVAPAFSR